MSKWAKRKTGEVFINVYDLHESNDTFYSWGIGMYHSGVQIGHFHVFDLKNINYLFNFYLFLDDKEYTFGGGGGIFTHQPRDVPSAKFRETVYLGEFKGKYSINCYIHTSF
jgi:hypothetical protein